MSDVLKVNPCASTEDISNTEKTLIDDSLGAAFGLPMLLERLALKCSAYYHAKARLARSDRHTSLTRLIVEIYKLNASRYGYRRIWLVLRNVHSIVVSEKVIGRLMAQEGLVAKCPRKRYRYNSYRREITDAPSNLINHNFSAEAPNEKWLTDITEMKASDGKLYLSPIIGCFDGMALA